MMPDWGHAKGIISLSKIMPYYENNMKKQWELALS